MSSDRSLHLFAATALAIVGFHGGSWILLAIGGVIAFLESYDLGPIWKAITSQFNKKPP